MINIIARIKNSIPLYCILTVNTYMLFEYIIYLRYDRFKKNQLK